MEDLMICEEAKEVPTPSALYPIASWPTESGVGLSASARVTRSEADLIRRVEAGDVEAFYELVRPLERAVFLAAHSLLRNAADAEEVAQEAILKAFKNLPRFRRESKFSTWLIQITINEAKMKLRRDRSFLYESLEEGRTSEDGEYVPREVADWREIPSTALEQKELRASLNRALDGLAVKYRAVIMLRDVQHFSVRETAQLLGLSEVNVKTRLSRARMQMRDAIAAEPSGAWHQPSRQGSPRIF